MNNYEYYGHVERGMELYHHGILGMHWGIRRYQPYRKGEYVKGGKEIGAAARRERHKDKMERLKEKTERANAKAALKAARHKGKKSKLEMLKEKLELKRAENSVAKEEYTSKLDAAQSKLDVAAAKAALKNVEKNPNSVGINGKGQGGQNFGPTVPVDSKKEQLKQNIIRSGDRKLIKQYERQLTNDEYRQAIERAGQRDKLMADIKNARANKIIGAGERITNTIRTAGNLADTAKDSYNKVATLQNFLAGDKGKKWKKISAPDTPETMQKKAAARKAREDIRLQYGVDPVTGARAKAIYDPTGKFIRYTTTLEEATGKFKIGSAGPNGEYDVIDTNDQISNFVGPLQPGQHDRRYTIR